MALQGWISLHRKLQDHWIWKGEPFSKGHAWIDLILSANHQDNKVVFKEGVILCERGSFITSIDTLSKRWKWGMKKTYSFLNLLKSDGMIGKESTTKWTKITLLEYSTYQSLGQAEDKPRENQGKTKDKRGETNNNDNKVNNEKNDNNTCLTFESFWSTYSKSVDKFKCSKSFNKIGELDRAVIKSKLPLYIESTPDSQFRKNPLTYLNGSCWNDEVEVKKRNGSAYPETVNFKLEDFQ